MTTLITPLPTPPTRQDSSNFNDRADDFLGALPLFQQEANGLAIDVQSSANEVEIARQAVVSVANVSKWISGNTYPEGSSVWSPINGVAYRKMTTSIGGTTDPSSDTTNYKSITDAAGFTYMPAGAGAVIANIQGKLREFVSIKDFGAVGDGIADDTVAIKNFFAAVATGKSGVMPAGVYAYNLATGGELSVDCTRFVLRASGATIQCSAYPSAGVGATINFVKIKATYIDADLPIIDGGWQRVGGRVDGYCTAGGYFNYMQGLVLSAQGGRIGDLEVHDCEGQGVTTESGTGISDVQFGTIRAHHNWMVGVDFRSTSGYTERLTIGQIIAYNNGTRGVGWVQVHVSDNKASAGARRIIIGSVIANNGGGSGFAVGQYANLSNGEVSGAQDVHVGHVMAFGNEGHGVEIYASINCRIESINAFSNGKRGVYFERSDTNDVWGYVNSVGHISATLNGNDGILISGVDNLEIGSVVSWNNGTGGSGYAGLALYAPSGLAKSESGHIQIGSVRLFDDSAIGSKTQEYGMSVSYYGQPTRYTNIVSLEATGNKTKDIAWLTFGNSKTITLGDASFDSIKPDYADLSRTLLAVGGTLRQKWRTTDATAIAPLVAKAKSGTDCIVTFTASGRNPDGTTTHYYTETSAYKWNGTQHTKVATISSAVNKTGVSDSYTNDFGTAIGGYVKGIASTTIDWDVTMQFSTSIDRDFAV